MASETPFGGLWKALLAIPLHFKIMIFGVFANFSLLIWSVAGGFALHLQHDRDLDVLMKQNIPFRIEALEKITEVSRLDRASMHEQQNLLGQQNALVLQRLQALDETMRMLFEREIPSRRK